MKPGILFWIFLFLSIMLSDNGNSQVKINEVMYAPSSPAKEWFEIYNAGTEAFNLQNWKWRDAAVSNPIRTITTQSVILNPGSFAIVCDDSANLRQNFPNISGIILQSIGWNALNNTGNENVVLYNSLNSTQDSLTYSNTWGGTGGYSLEKINPSGPTNLQSNWGTSISSFKGTPNSVNSITPRLNDLWLKSFSILPSNPSTGDSLKFQILVKNKGINPANNFDVKLFRDLNFDSIYQATELIFNQNYSSLNPDDSAIFNYGIGNIDSGMKQFIGYVSYFQDEDTINNKSVKSVNVGGISVSSGILINEIMFAPQAPEPEWIEIINSSNTSINIKNWKIADSSALNNPLTIVSEDYNIQPNSLVVIAKNNSIIPRHPLIDTSRIIYLGNLPTLNNDKDVVAIFNNSGTMIDYVSYKSSWGGNFGNSLERINPNKPSGDSSNWAASVDCEYSTPTRTNSYTNITGYNKKDLIVNEIMFDPLTGNPEWLELYNSSNLPINLTGWKLSESSNFHTLSDTCNFFLNPGDYFVLAADTNLYNRFSYLRNPASNQKIIFRAALSLSNDGEIIKIYDAMNNVIDSVSYSPKWHNINIPDTKGFSLERINPYLGSNDISNWTSCANPAGGSPGLRNSVFITNQLTPSKISISPNPFSPDGDGIDEVTFINYKLSVPVSQIKIKIYDVKGRLVRNLINNQVSGSEGTVIFNGYDDDGKKLRLGIYVIFLEFVDGRGGIVDNAKATVVVAAKLN